MKLALAPTAEAVELIVAGEEAGSAVDGEEGSVDIRLTLHVCSRTYLDRFSLGHFLQTLRTFDITISQFVQLWSPQKLFGDSIFLTADSILT